MKKIAGKVLLLLLLLVVAWRVLVTGMADHYVRKATLGDVSAVDKALTWNGRNASALYLKALSIEGDDPSTAINLLQRAININPVDAHSLVVLARLQFAGGDVTRSDRTMEAAVGLMPANVQVRTQAANYWSARGQLDRVLQNWDAALVLSPNLGKRIFPAMLELLKTDKGIGLFKPLTDNPPDWWPLFFKYLTEDADNLGMVVGVATMRHDSVVPLSRDERDFLVARLQKEGQWAEAYLVWVNGLSSSERRYLGSLFNGGFEIPASNQGFDWHLPEMKEVQVRMRETYGVEGKKALVLIFKGKERKFHHLYQYLFLTPGTHEFMGMSRVDSLRTRGGLRWVVRCAGDMDLILGESDRMVGASDWESTSFQFNVPGRGTCASQILRLESTGKHLYDHKIEGELWFDRLQIFSREN